MVIILISNNIVSFVNSQDGIRYDFKTKLLYFLGLIFLCVAQILINTYVDHYPFSYVDFITSICYLGCCSIVFFISFILKKQKYKYLTYGTGYLLISSYLCYFAMRITLFPLSAWYGFIGIALWMIVSVVCIASINSNIKKGYYNQDSAAILSETSKDGVKYGVVITWKTFLQASLYVLVILGVIVVYSLFPEIFTATDRTFSKIFQIGLLCCLFILSFVASFAWKLIIKFFIMVKYKL